VTTVWHWYSLPFRLVAWPFAFVLGCAILLRVEALREYAGAEEVLRDGRSRRRPFPLREWWVTFMRATFPELTQGKD
jgi:hypothetical protein